jgi:hypothetical protein
MAAPFPEVAEIARLLPNDRNLELSPTTRFDDLANWHRADLIIVVAEADRPHFVPFDDREIDRVVTARNQAQIEAKPARALV